MVAALDIDDSHVFGSTTTWTLVWETNYSSKITNLCSGLAAAGQTR